MNCAELETLICDYVDGTLTPAVRAEVQQHLAGCPACAELAADSAAALSFIERAADVEPPPELLTRILYDPPWAKSRSASGARKWLHGLLDPALRPRFAMGMALTILSFAMLAPFVARVRQLGPADLDPVKVWTALDDRLYRTWERTVKFYDSVRFVYQIQNRLREWQQQQEEEQKASATEPAADERRLPTKSPPPQDAPGTK